MNVIQSIEILNYTFIHRNSLKRIETNDKKNVNFGLMIDGSR